MNRDPTSDPVLTIIGSTFLGAIAKWAFDRMRESRRPKLSREDVTRVIESVMNGKHSAVMAEMKQINRRIGTIEGTLRGAGYDIPEHGGLGD